MWARPDHWHAGCRSGEASIIGMLNPSTKRDLAVAGACFPSPAENLPRRAARDKPQRWARDPSVAGSNPTDGPSQESRTAAVVRGLQAATADHARPYAPAAGFSTTSPAWSYSGAEAVRRRRVAGIDAPCQMTLSMTT